MKQIGYVDRAMTAQAVWKTHKLGMLSPHDLFIPNPGERENVNADQWTHVGWVDPDKDGGQIWGTHAEAGDNSRPAYVQREVITIHDPEPTYHRLLSDPMDVRRSEFERLDRAIQDLFQAIKPEPTPSVAADQPMTFYDHAFIHAAVNHADYYAGVVLTPKIIDDAHAVASMLTRNRVNRP